MPAPPDRNALPTVNLNEPVPVRTDYQEVAGGTVVGSADPHHAPATFDPNVGRQPVIVDIAEYAARGVLPPLPHAARAGENLPAARKAAAASRTAPALSLPIQASTSLPPSLAPALAANSLPPAALPPTFEELGCPWLGRHAALDPAVQVVFEFPGRGQMATYYHWVVLGKISLMLVWDNRSKASQFVPQCPPNESLLVTIPRLERSWKARVIDMELVIGIMDLVILFLPSGEQEEEPDEEQAPPAADFGFTPPMDESRWP